MARILLVEDEEALSQLISKWLKTELHTVESCGNGNEAIALLERHNFDVIILDLLLPGIDGIEVCKRFRAGGGVTPILMVTAKRTLNDKETGLDSGADDYLTKPFKLRELSARVRALLRRQPVLVPALLKVDDLVLDTISNRVFRADQEVKLVPKEFSVLELLMKNAGKVTKTESLIECVWGLNSDVSPETIRSYVRLLRQKVDRPGEDSLIKTMHGVGYMMGSDSVQ